MLQNKSSFHSDSWNESTSASAVWIICGTELPCKLRAIKHPLPQLGAAVGLSCGDVSRGKMKQPADLSVQGFNKKFSFWAPLPVNNKSFPAFFLLCRWALFFTNTREQFCLFLPPVRSLCQWNGLPPRHISLAWLGCYVRNTKIIMLPFTLSHEVRFNSLLSFPFCPLKFTCQYLKGRAVLIQVQQRIWSLKTTTLPKIRNNFKVHHCFWRAAKTMWMIHKR